MKRIFFSISLMCFSVFLFSTTQNRDKPLHGEWDFRLERVWQVEKAGEDVFGLPFTLTAAEDGKLYVFDPKNGLNYIFNEDGGLMKTFGSSGQGPGEIIGQERTYLIDGKLAIIARNGIHFFSREGEYLETIREEKIRRPPQIIISGKEFIAFPMTGIGASEGKGEMFYCRLDSGEERKLAEFSLTQAGIAQAEENVVDIIVVGMSPLPAAGYDRGSVYWGVSHSYEIHISDLEGRELGKFSLDRKAKSVSTSFKRKYLKSMNIPPELANPMEKSFPNRLAHFHRIEIHDGLVYVFVPQLDLGQGTPRIAQIDIFSPEGRYLYRAHLDFGKGLTHLFSPLSNLVFKNGYLYAFCVREDDTVVLAKYIAQMPKGSE